jgi:hypothetical protein
MKNLRGSVFGKLTVQQENPERTPTGKVRWDCTCSCGTAVTVVSSNLNSGNTRGCGKCRAPRTPETRALVAHYNNYKNNAKTKGIEFSVDFDKFSELVKNKCHYCDHDPVLRDFSKYVGADYSRNFATAMTTRVNGLDKVDPDRGYTLDNVVPCCSDCNYAKHRLSQPAFVAMCRRVVAKWGPGF